MRFTEIANPEDQLALWKLVSDKMWAAFGQQALQTPNFMPTQQLATSTLKAAAKPISRAPAKLLGKSSSRPVKAPKPKKGPMAATPKPLPKPKPQQLSLSQSKQVQAQQQQQLANEINRALMKIPSSKLPAQHANSNGHAPLIAEPMNSGYTERDLDDLVMHRRQNPFKPLDIK